MRDRGCRELAGRSNRGDRDDRIQGLTQYNKPNSQRGILSPWPMSMLSLTTKLSSIFLICEKPLLLPPTSKSHFPSTTKSPWTACAADA